MITPFTSAQLATVVGAIAVGLVLVRSGVAHLRHIEAFSLILRAQGTPADSLARSLAVVVGAAETLVGSIMLGGIVASQASWLRAAALCAAAMFAVFATHLALLLRKAPNVPCGCGAASTPVSIWGVVRAGALGLLAIVAGLGAGSTSHPIPTEVWAMGAVGGAAFGTVLWLLPDAMTTRVPGQAWEAEVDGFHEL